MGKGLVAGFWIFFILVIVGASFAKGDTNMVDSVTQYIDLDKCDKQRRDNLYTVCWDAARKVPVSGWSEIYSDKIDVGNIKARPNFYKDQMVDTIAPSQIKLPNERGHTFANDSDNDYSPESLKATYNMINITPMYEALNVGMWRKVENRGKTLAKQYLSITSITLVEYFPDKKYDLVYPKRYIRIYSNPGLGIEECYAADNKKISAPLSTIKINCDEVKLK